MAAASSQTWVVDSSVILKWIISHKEDWLDQADLLLKNFKTGKINLAAPVLVTANPKHQKDFPGVKTVDLKDYGPAN